MTVADNLPFPEEKANPAGAPALSDNLGDTGFNLPTGSLAKTVNPFIVANGRILTDAHFPADAFILDQSRFWFTIFSTVSGKEGLLHDAAVPTLVYQKISAPGAFTKPGRKWVEQAINNLKADLQSLAQGNADASSPELRRLKALLPSAWDSTAIIAAAERVRFQRGMKEHYLAGLSRSYSHLVAIESCFAARGLPTRLKYLPHVESSFQPFAYSKVGAAGMWQFMKGTAKHYGMKTTYLIDERRDPRRSTDAASRMLGSNYRLLKTWPLALTAYNHGPSGMARAVRTVGSSDLSLIIRTYAGRAFGFASSNFYAEFLAASSLAMQADIWFPGHAKDAPLQLTSIALDKPTSITQILQASGLRPIELEACNLSLRPAVFRSKQKLPKGFVLHLPESVNLLAFNQIVKGETLALAQTNSTEERLARADLDSLSVAPADKVEPILAMNNSLRNGQASEPLKTQTALKPTAEKLIQITKGPALSKDASISASAKPALDKGPSLPQSQSAALKARPPVEAATALPSVQPGLHVDSAYALMITDMESVAHPWDRFNPAVYHLIYEQTPNRLTFESGPDETISHYSDWSSLPAATIRKVNHLRGKAGIALGRKVVLPLDSLAAAAFIRRREENWRAAEEDFYGSYHVSSLEKSVATSGFSVWKLAYEREIPYWLLQKHNANLQLGALHPGDSLNVPVIVPGLRRWAFTRYTGPQDQIRAFAIRLQGPLP